MSYSNFIRKGQFKKKKYEKSLDPTDIIKQDFCSVKIEVSSRQNYSKKKT